MVNLELISSIYVYKNVKYIATKKKNWSFPFSYPAATLTKMYISFYSNYLLFKY